MPRHEHTIEIAAPPEVVWGVMADIERWPEWTDSVHALEKLDEGELTAGTRARIDLAGAPTAVWTVTSVAPGRAFAWESRARGVHTIATHTIEPAGPGSRVRLELDSSGLMATLLGPLIGRVARRNVSMEAEGLKRRAEEVAAGD